MASLRQAPRVRSNALPLRAYKGGGRPVAITGLGTHVPEKVFTNFDLEKLMDTSDEWIRERTGIARRHLADPGTATWELAAVAARRALDEAGVEASDLDLIVVATSTPDAPFPSIACRVQEELGAQGAAAYDLLAACSGFVYALSSADMAIASGRAERVLVVGAEVLTRMVDWNYRATAALFGDGAGAAVLEPAKRGAGFLSWCLGADGRGHDQIAAGDVTRGCYAAGEAKPVITMKGPDVFRFAVDILIRQAYACAEVAGVNVDDIDLWVPHQANRRIIEAAASRIGLPMERVMCNIEEYANTSTASIPLALDEAVRSGRVKPGDKILMAGFGSGLTWGSCLLEWE